MGPRRGVGRGKAIAAPPCTGTSEDSPSAALLAACASAPSALQRPRRCCACVVHPRRWRAAGALCARLRGSLAPTRAPQLTPLLRHERERLRSHRPPSRTQRLDLPQPRRNGIAHSLDAPTTPPRHPLTASVPSHCARPFDCTPTRNARTSRTVRVIACPTGPRQPFERESSSWFPPFGWRGGSDKFTLSSARREPPCPRSCLARYAPC